LELPLAGVSLELGGNVLVELRRPNVPLEFCGMVPLKLRCPSPCGITWQVWHEPSPYTDVRFVRYWGRAKESGIPIRIIDINKSNMIADFLFIFFSLFTIPK
jgi:hypothetical protein